MGVMMLVVSLPLLLIVVWALRQFGQPPRGNEPPSPPPSEPDAREIARRAYARGELDRERYRQIIEDLDEAQRRRDAPR
jgi:uncharacterized membrane protein